ncbi:MAG: Ig-like domain-containing protein, partial [Acidobacteriota bacterium]
AQVGGAADVRISPIAFEDRYDDHCGNTRLEIRGSSALLANDFDPNPGDTLTIVDLAGNAIAGGGGPYGPFTLMDGATTLGQVTLLDETTGELDFDPAPGFLGTAAFEYTVTDTIFQTTTRAVITVDELVWFVDHANDTTGGDDGTGTLQDPFESLAQLNGAGGVGDVDEPGHLIFIRDSGVGDYEGGLELEDGQVVIGEIEGLTACVGTPIVPDGAGDHRPDIINSGGGAVTVGQNNTLRGLRIADATQGIAGSAVGTLTVSNTDVAAIAGSGVDINGGTLDVTLNSVSTTGSGGGTRGVATIIPGIRLHNITAGSTFTVTGATNIVDASGQGISVENGAGASFDFGATTVGVIQDGASADGGVLIDTGNAGASFTFDTLAIDSVESGLVTNGSGTVNINSTAATIIARGGPAALLVNTVGQTNGAPGWTFQSLTSTEVNNNSALVLTGLAVPVTVGTVSFQQAIQPAVDVNGTTGAIAINGGTINHARPSAAIDIDGGSGDFTYAGNVGQTGSGQTVQVQNRSSGAHTWSGDVSGTGGGGVRLVSNAGATFSFTGDTDLTTANRTAFTATGGGTVTVTGAGNTIAVAETGGGAGNAQSAVVLNGVAVGAADITFQSIQVTGTAAGAPGLDFDAVSGTGTFRGGAVTVNRTGTGAAGIDIAASPAAFTFTGATVDDTGGDGLRLNGANGAVTFTTVDIDGTGGHGLGVIGNTAAVNVNGGTIGAAATTAGNAVDVDGGAGNVTVAAAITNQENFAAEITGRTGGTVELSGPVVDDDPDGTLNRGIRVASNSSGSPVVRFSGAVDVINSAATAVEVATNTGATVGFANLDINNSGNNNRALFATATGRLNVDTGTVDAGSGRAVDLDNTLLGNSGSTAAGLSLVRVRSVGGTEPGIDLDTTTGAFSVLGDGGGANNGSGGTISGKAGPGDGTDAVRLSAAANVQLAYMNLTNNNRNGVFGANVNGFRLHRSNVTGNGNQTSPTEGNLRFDELIGTGAAGSNPTSITFSTFENSRNDNALIRNTAGTLADLVVQNSTFRDSQGAGLGSSGLVLDSRAAASMRTSITDTNFINHKANGLILDASGGTSSVEGVITRGTFDGNNVGVTVSVANGGDARFRGQNAMVVGHDSHGLNVFTNASSTGSVSGTWINNTIGTLGTMGSGSVNGSGIRVAAEGSGDVTVLIDGNTVQEVSNFEGIFVNERLNAGDTHVQITNNTVRETDFDRGIFVEARGTGTICTNIQGNTTANTGSDGIRVRQRDTATLQVERYNGAANDTAAMEARLTADNPLANSVDATVATAFATPVANGACREPVL